MAGESGRAGEGEYSQRVTVAPDPLAPVPPALDLVREFIRADAAAGRLQDWGASTLIDEHTGVPSIDRELADELHRAAGIPARFPIGNAGLLHVYGYWFSTVRTPFGYKRDRWVDGDLARAFGLEREAFHLDASADTTPLQRVTGAALPVLQSPPSGSLAAETIVGDARTRVVLLQRPGADTPALVYGISPREGESFALITTFPFAGDLAEMLQEFASNPVLRWNAAQS